ncbi:MAG: hypothetical protein RID53_02385 [Coleofasciculus sp. B1-GNL1-01]
MHQYPRLRGNAIAYSEDSPTANLSAIELKSVHFEITETLDIP